MEEVITSRFSEELVNNKKLEFIPMGAEVSVDMKERRVKLPALFALALEIGSKTDVKTLDTLHLASASVASKIYGHKIDYFVTLDEDILKLREQISSLIESRVVSPAGPTLKNQILAFINTCQLRLHHFWIFGP